MREDPMSLRAILDNCIPCSSATRIKEWRTRIRNMVIVSIDSTPVYTVHDVETALHMAIDTDSSKVNITFAPIKHIPSHDANSIP